jgi:hypothetical protein
LTLPSTYKMYRLHGARVTSLPQKLLHPGHLRNRIAELAKAGAISFSVHAFARSSERRIDIYDATRVLLLGEIEGPIAPGVNADEWKCKIVARAEDSLRRIGVVSVVVKDQHLFIITVEWEEQ